MHAIPLAVTPTPTPSGGSGYALQFDGIDDLVNLWDSAILNPTDAYTIEAWVKPDGSGGTRAIFTRYNGGVVGCYQLNVDATNGLPAAPLFSSEQPFGWVKSDTPLQPEVWSFVTGVFDHGTISLFVNGRFKGSTGGVGTNSAMIPTLIGASMKQGEPVECWSGVIDEVRFWSYARVLNETDMMTDAHRALPWSEPGLAGYWQFDEGEGQVSLDGTWIGNHAIRGLSDQPGDDDPQWVVSDVPVTPLVNPPASPTPTATDTPAPPTPTSIPTVEAPSLLVTDRCEQQILAFDAKSGGFHRVYASGSELWQPYGMEYGPDGNLYVANISGNNVLKYDAATGVFLGEFVAAYSGGLSSPHDLTFGPDGRLYVTSWSTNEVVRYDGLTGAFIDIFVSAGSGGLNNPLGIVFGPDGNIYVCSRGSNRILRYRGGTGELIDEFVGPGDGGMDGPVKLAFGSDGNLYVASALSDNILRFDGSTGAFIDTFVPAGSGGLTFPVDLVFGPGGDLYVTGWDPADVLRYDGATGEFVDVFVAAGTGGMGCPTGIAFMPGPLAVTVDAHIEPSEPRTLDDLECVAEIGNPGGNPDLVTSYRWFRDSVEILEPLEVGGEVYPATEPTLSHHFTARDQDFSCIARVTDGLSFVEAETAPVTIVNSTPSAPVVEIRPPEPMPGEDLGINILVYSTDPDGDEVDYRIDWYESEDGGETWVHKVEFTDAAFISGIYLQEGDLWRVEVTPFEVVVGKMNAEAAAAVVEGEAGWDQVYVGENSDPTVAVGLPGAENAVAAPEVAIAWEAQDADGDPVTVDLYYDTDNVKGGAVLIASGLPAAGSMRWAPPGAMREAPGLDVSDDEQINAKDLFLLAARWMEEPPGARYRIFARTFDVKGAMGEAFSEGEVIAATEMTFEPGVLARFLRQWGPYVR